MDYDAIVEQVMTVVRPHVGAGEVAGPALYVGLIAAGAIIFTTAPLIQEGFKKPSWKPAPEPDQAPAVR